MNDKLEFNYDLTTTYDPVRKIWSGAAHLPYYDTNCSMGRILFQEMRRNPQRICQIDDPSNLVMTNEEVLLQAIRIASHFRTLCITQRDIIGIVARNTSYLTAVILACYFNCTAFHSINPLQDTKTTKTLLGITKPKLLFCDGNIYEKIKIASNNLKMKIITLSEHISRVDTVLDFIKASGEEYKFQPAELEYGPDQTVAILCSSGSTGTPKAVTISNNARLYECTEYLTSDDIVYATSSIDWLSGLLLFLDNIIYGATKIVSNVPFSAEYYLDLIEKYKVTYTSVAPPQISILINSPLISKKKLASLRYMLYGGGKCTTQTQLKMQSYMEKGRICFGYGLTECASVLTRNFQFEEKPNSSGRLIPGFKIKIIDDDGTALGPCEAGEICCYHGRKWNGYYGNDKDTKTMFDEASWFHTGDIGYFDEDGYLFVVERKKNMLKCRSMMYYPNEIEEVIAEMPDVVDVCVVGVWNELEGDLPGAVVVKKKCSSLMSEDVERYVVNHIDSEFKHLHAGALIMDEMPKNPNGKVDRATVHKIFLEKIYK